MAISAKRKRGAGSLGRGSSSSDDSVGARPSLGKRQLWLIAGIAVVAIVVLFVGLSASTRQALFGQVIQTGDDEEMYGQDTGSSGGSSSSSSSLPPELGCTVILTNPSAEAYAWWRFDGNVNYVDNWGQAYPPATGTSWTVGTPAYGTGKVGQAFNFEGSNYISIPDAPWQDATGTLSIDAWIYPKKKANMQIVRKHDGTNGYNLVTTSGGNIKFWINGIYARSKDTYKVNAWNHIAVVYYPGNTIKIFINGKESEIYTLEMGTVPASIGTNNQPLLIGGGVSGQNFNGYIDEVTIYLNKALVLKDAQRLVAVGNDPNGGEGKCVILPPSGGNTRAAAGCAPVPAGLTGWTTMDWQGNYLDSVGNLRQAYYPWGNPALSNNGEVDYYAGSGSGEWPYPPYNLFYEQGKVGKALVGITPYWHENTGSFYGTIRIYKSLEGAAWVGGLPGPLTIEVWISPNELQTANLVANYNYGAQQQEDFNPSDMRGYMLRTLADGKIRFYINGIYLDSTNTGWYGDQNTYDWRHIAAVYVPGQSMKIYINGVLKGERTTGIPSSILYGNDFGHSEVWIEGMHTSWAPYVYPTRFNGKLDEFSIYNTAVSQQEIQAIYNAGSAGKCPLGITLEQAAASEEAAGYQQFILPEGTNLEVLGTAAGIVSGGGGSVVSDTDTEIPTDAGLPSFGKTCTASPTNLVSWWRGEDTADSQGVNTATLQGGAVAGQPEGKAGNTFSFDGTDDMISIGDTASLDITGALTLEAWINPTTPGNRQVLRKHDNTNGYAFSTTSAGKIRFWINGVNLESLGTYPANAWTHVVAVYTPGAFMGIYINGVLDGTGKIVTGVPASIGANTQPFKIGGGVAGQFFSGKVDEVSIYSRALTATEISSLYSADTAGKCVPSAPAAAPLPTTQSGCLATANYYWDAVANTCHADSCPGGKVDQNSDRICGKGIQTSCAQNAECDSTLCTVISGVNVCWPSTQLGCTAVNKFWNSANTDNKCYNACPPGTVDSNNDKVCEVPGCGPSNAAACTTQTECVAANQLWQAGSCRVAAAGCGTGYVDTTNDRVCKKAIGQSCGADNSLCESGLCQSTICWPTTQSDCFTHFNNARWYTNKCYMTCPQGTTATGLDTNGDGMCTTTTTTTAACTNAFNYDLINAELCSGDDQGLTGPTNINLIGGNCVAGNPVKCEYKCKAGFQKSGSACVAAYAAGCIGGFPSTSTLCSGDNQQIPVGQETYSLVDSCTEGVKCERTCNAGYTRSGTNCVAVTSYKCSGSSAANSALCTGDDSGLAADTTYSLVGACSGTVKCERTCNEGYKKSGTTCKKSKGNSCTSNSQCLSGYSCQSNVCQPVAVPSTHTGACPAASGYSCSFDKTGCDSGQYPNFLQCAAGVVCENNACGLPTAVDSDNDGVTDNLEPAVCVGRGTVGTVGSNGCPYGDHNQDGCVNFDDVAVIAQYVDFDCGAPGPHPANTPGDVDSNGCVNFDDVAVIAPNVDFDCVPQ